MAAKNKSRKTGKSVKAKTAPAEVSPLSEMERMFHEFDRHGWLRPFSWEWPAWSLEAGAPFEGRMPKVDMVEEDEALVIHAELPGVKKDDLEITLAENALTIEAHTSHEEKKQKKGKVYRREMSRGDFRRSLTLPCRVDVAKAKASFSDGVLELTLPKAESTGGTRVKVD